MRIPNVSRGGYQILVALDDPDTVVENSEANNVNSVPFTVSPNIGGPDLLVSTASIEDETVEPGGRVSVDYRVANRGRSSVGDYRVAFYLAAPNSRPADWVPLEDEVLGGLDADETEDESEQVTIPPTTAPGQYGLIIVLDDGNAIAEQDETNNDTGFTIQVRNATAGENVPRASALSLVASPNPTGASIRLSYTLNEAQSVHVSVVDALGREVADIEGARGAGVHTEALDVAAWAPGVYVARLTAGAETATHLVTVAR